MYYRNIKMIHHRLLVDHVYAVVIFCYLVDNPYCIIIVIRFIHDCPFKPKSMTLFAVLIQSSNIFRLWHCKKSRVVIILIIL